MALFIDKMTGNIIDQPFHAKNEESFKEDTFEVDTLVSPVISILIKKGYMTRACCSGHVSDTFVNNFNECIDDTNSEYRYEKFDMASNPYIALERGVEPYMKKLPPQWKWDMMYFYPSFYEYEHDSIAIWSESTFEMDDGEQIPVEVIGFEPRYKEKYPNFAEGEPIKNFVISPNMRYFNNLNLDSEKYESYCVENPYEHYTKIVEALHDLYLWAKNLPEAKQEK